MQTMAAIFSMRSGTCYDHHITYDTPLVRRRGAALGGRAKRRAVTCVKPEQASKGKLWTPTRPEFGEGSTVWGSSRQMHLDRSTGVMGTARRDRWSGKRDIRRHISKKRRILAVIDTKRLSHRKSRQTTSAPKAEP